MVWSSIKPAKISIFQSKIERLKLGIQGKYPDYLIEVTGKNKEIRHKINEQFTRPWIKFYFHMYAQREEPSLDDPLARTTNLIEILKTTIPLASNSYSESKMSSWRMFLDSVFRDSDAPWYNGIKKNLVRDRFYNTIEHLELEIPLSNTQRDFLFRDHTNSLRKIPRVPIKILFSISGNEKEKLFEIMRQAVHENPHNLDLAFLTYCLYKASNRASEFYDLANQENRSELLEWYFWVEQDMKSLGEIKQQSRDYITSFFIYDRAMMNISEYKNIAAWFLNESEFKLAYHFYSKAKEFETAIELLQNLSTKEFAELINLRRISKGEKTLDLQSDSPRVATLYQEEMETLRGFARLRAAETYKEVSLRARQHFDRETIETKYAFGELTEEEYQRLIRQLQERSQ